MISFLKGPSGYAVLVAGKPVGAIRKSGMGFYQVSIKGFRPGIGDGKNHTFATLREAKKAVDLAVWEASPPDHFG